MPKRILIVESDPDQSLEMRAALEGRGFAVEETPHGKTAVDLVRESRPNLVILSVELAAGQSGYLICGKIKKDEELKSIPVVIVGNADGFVQHSKLKTRADEYVPKPVDADALVERVAGQIGWPEPDAGEEHSLGLDDVVEDGAVGPSEEITLEEATIEGDPDLDMLDSAFEGMTVASEQAAPQPEEGVEELVELAPEEPVLEGESFVDAQDASAAEDRAAQGSSEDDSADDREAGRSDGSQPARSGPTGSALEVRALRAQLNSLKKSLSEAQSRQNDAEEKVRELEAQLESRVAELEAIVSTSGKGDKEFFALREALNKKEKDILLLTTKIKDRESEMVELRDHEVQLEQKVSEAAVELARRDAQLKALTGRTDNFAVDRKKLQEELNEARNRLQASESEAEEMRSMISQMESNANQGQDEVQQLRSQLDELQRDTESQVKRIQEMEELAGKHEERINKLYQRIKSDEKIREKTKKALSIALHLLEEQSAIDEEDEPAAA